MTTTSARATGFPKSLAVILAAVAVAAIAIWITQQVGPETRSPIEASESVEQQSGTSGLIWAYEAGKFDAGINSIPSYVAPVSAAAPVIVAVEGEGSLYDALIAGKFDLDAAGIKYVASSNPESGQSGLWAAYESGQLTESTGGTELSPRLSATRAKTSTISGGHLE